jgi:hypothetical protein
MESKLSREEIIFRVKGSGCKMLNRLDLHQMSKEEIISHLKKSCCKVYEKLSAKYNLDGGDTVITRKNNY